MNEFTLRHNATYRRMKEAIDAEHPRGWFVAVSDEKIIAADADFHKLEAILRSQGNDPRKVLVVEAGADYPENVTIFI